jgi:hypothetical protein
MHLGSVTLFRDFVRRLVFQKQCVSETGSVLRPSFFGDVMQRSFVVSCRRFERSVLELLNPWKWDRQVVPKRRQLTTKLRWVTSQKNEDLINTAVDAGNHAWLCFISQVKRWRGISYSVGCDKMAVLNLWSRYSVSVALWWLWNSVGWTKSINQVFWRVKILFWSMCVLYNCVSSYASTVRWKKNSFSAKKVINS